MKGLIIFLVISFCAVSLQAQECDSIAQSIVEKIKNYSPDDLLPYYDKTSQKWGIMSKNGKILTQPIKEYPSKLSFDPDFECVLWDKWCSIFIKRSDYSYVAENSTEEHRVALMASSNPNVKGFKTYKNSKTIDEYSNLYNQMDDKAFMYNNRLYAIAQLAENNKFGIIDQDGNALSYFDFKYKSLSLITVCRDTTQLWFYVEYETGKKGFVSTGGKTKLYGELLSHVYNSNIQVQQSKEKSGVLDLRTLEWAIKPQKKLKIEDTIIKVGKNDKNFTYYVVVSEGNEKYLIDMRKKVYKPIQ